MLDIITDHIDIWTSAKTPKTNGARGRSKNGEQAQYGIKKLRELILELAVRGKLVPQDPKDQPASVLLEEIAKERAKLIAAGKIKKRMLPPIDSCPFALPNGWEMVRFGAVAEIERGGSPRPIDSFITNEPDGLNWIKIGDTDQGGKYITSAAEKIRREGLSKTRMVYPGDFLLTNSMSFGRPYISKIEGCIHDGWLRISPPSLVDKDYLYLLLSSPYMIRAFEESAAGAVVLNLNADKVREVCVLVPPINEQHRIVAKFDKLMALCDQLEKQQTDNDAAHKTLVETLLGSLTNSANADDFQQAWKLIENNFDTLFTTEHSIDQLKKTILQLAVMGKLVPQDPNDEPAAILLQKIAAEKAGSSTKEVPAPEISMDEQPYALPNGWGWGRFENIWKDSFYGPRFGKNEYVASGGYPTIRTTDMTTDGKINLKNPPEVLVDESKLLLYRLEKGDLLITRSGSIGTMAVYDLDIIAIPSAYLIRIRLSKAILPEYVMLILKSSLGQSYLGLNTTSVGVPNINATKMAQFVFPIAPKDEQNRIIAKVNELMTVCDLLKKRFFEAQLIQSRLADTIVERVTLS